MAPVWWPYAIQHFCFASNIEVVDGDSAWNKRHKQGHFKGDLFPFGSKVYFHPTPPKAKKQHKFEGKGKPGIFLRYFVKSGGHWTRTCGYEVIDCDDLSTDTWFLDSS